jgi:hypothetical protein
VQNGPNSRLRLTDERFASVNMLNRLEHAECSGRLLTDPLKTETAAGQKGIFYPDMGEIE